MGLTDLAVRKMTPKKSRFEVLDNDGLYIRILPTGNKSWVFRYNFEGTARRMTLGGYPGFSLSEAREKHAQAMQDIGRGIDPGLKAQKEKAKRKAEPNFKDLLDEFWDHELSLQKSAKERKRMVEKDVMKRWGKRKVSTITRRDAVLLLDKVRERAPVGANRLQSVLVRMFNFASERGIIENSPLAGMKRKKEQAKSRVLEDGEIKLLWDALDLERTDIDIYRPVKLALRMILLTGQRPGEVSGMAWADIQGDVWTIPREKSKVEGNSVPLLPMAQEVLEMAKVYSGENPFVFPSSHNEGRPMTVRALSNAIRRHRSEIGIEEPFTPHDLRRTLRTRLAKLGVSDIVSEKVLGHKLGGMLAIYNQYDYASEKSEALRMWERALKKIVGIETNGSAKVVNIMARRHA